MHSIKRRIKKKYKKLSFYLKRQLVHYLFWNKSVKNGIFKGMKYINTSHGSAFLPKLIGSYECELHEDIINFLNKNTYKNIVIIGCAEGYYAVGLALLSKHSYIHAYDINEKDLSLCSKLSKINNIDPNKFKLASLFE